MNQLRSILVAVDFSACSDAAFAQACRIASCHGATLHVLHVADELTPRHIARALNLSTGDARNHIVSHTRQRVRRQLAEVDAPGDVEIHTSFGTPISEFLTRTEAAKADLFVAGVRGLHDSPGVGSEASKCVRKVPTRVMLVSEDSAGPFNNVLACVDFSDTSKEVLRNAARVARRDQSTLHVIHVFHGPWHDLHYRAPTPEASVEFRTEFAAELEASLADFLEPFQAEFDGIDVKASLQDSDSYGVGIVEYAQDVGCDLVVIGTRGRTNLRYILLGSTAERVLKQAPCSVLAIKPEDPS